MERIRRRKRIKWGRVILALMLIISIISILGINTYKYFNQIEEKKNNINNTPSLDEIIEEEKQEQYSISLVMVGDALIHDKIYNEAKTLGNGIYDFKPMLSLIKPIVSKYDLAYYNQETILGGSDIGVSSYPAFNSPYEVGDAFLDAGFNLVSLATNHTIDRGEKAVINSRNYWNSKEEVLAVGSYSSFEECNEIQYRSSNNISYTMLNYTYGTNGIRVPSGKEYLVNVWPVTGNNPDTDTKYQAYKEQVKSDIASVRDKVDVLIVAMHWGVEYTHEPTAYEKDMAQYLASLDVDIIIGTHPHVIQPITWIDDTLVIYSLGNLISAQYQDDNYNKMVGLMTSLEINKTVTDDEKIITIDNIDNELIYTYYKNWRNFKVVPFSSSEIGKYLPNYKSVYERYKNIVQKYDSSISVKPLSEV